MYLVKVSFNELHAIKSFLISKISVISKKIVLIDKNQV